MNKKVLVIVLLALALLAALAWWLLPLASAGKQTSQKARIVTAREQAFVQQEFYTGSIAPLNITSVSSPVPGHIAKMNFHYGAMVKKGQFLITIRSTQLEKDYQTALTDFVKAKDEFLRSKNSFAGTEKLWQAQIISAEQYANEKSQLESNQLAYITATNKLQEAAAKLPQMAAVDAKHIQLSNVDEIRRILSQRVSNLAIKSPASGIVLFPHNSNSKTNQKEIHVGAEVKQGQVILNIGNLNGLSIQININELNVNHIKKGMQAIITLPALPDVELQGNVTSVAAQAKTSASGDQPRFPATVTVIKLDPKILAKLRIGMEAKVAIVLQNKQALQLPIAAVFLQDGKNWVTRINPRNGKRQNVVVTTGETNQQNVIIKSGLKAGDRVLVHDSIS